MAGEPWLTDEEFARLRALVAAESGIQIRDERRPFVAQRLAARLAALGAEADPGHVAAYRKRLEGGQDRGELLALLESLAITETGFFRHLPQWELFSRRLLPELLAAGQRAGRRLRLWSAGCSIGAEPYTMAMLVAEGLAAAGALPSSWDVRIRASDLSLRALAVTEAAVYPPERLAGVSPERLARHFVREGESYRVRDELRRWVEVDFHNLLHPVAWPGDGRGFDAIVCRNVLIYFSEADQAVAIRHLAAALRPGGYLLLGPAESLLGVVDGFRFVHEAGGTAYQKVAG
ncbi:MAG TPA: protein-glutamate O-methyltransferase CheR [Thermodesulfobacteriota bacterium]|nr:protein-glutamate O-methyltransferase CheR [Thermodesulfobacteriota bacterium]